MEAATTPLAESLALAHSLGVEIRRPEGFDRLLESRPAMAIQIRAAVSALRDAFGTNGSLVLDLFVDPDGADGEPEVFAVAVTSLPVLDANARLDSAVERWLDSNPDPECHVGFAVEYA